MASDDPGALPTGRFKADYAPTNRSKCTYCKEPIDERHFRVGPEFASKRWHRDYITWYHYKCFQQAGKRFSSISAVQGYDTLQPDAKVFIEAMLSRPAAAVSSERSGGGGGGGAASSPGARTRDKQAELKRLARKHFQQDMVAGDNAKVIEYLNLVPELVNDQSIFTDRVPPLTFAVMRGHTDLARQLLGRGAHVNLRDTRNETALHKAVRNNDVASVRLLLERGSSTADVNDVGQTPLDIARDKQLYEIAELLDPSPPLPPPLRGPPAPASASSTTRANRDTSSPARVPDNVPTSSEPRGQPQPQGRETQDQQEPPCRMTRRQSTLLAQDSDAPKRPEHPTNDDRGSLGKRARVNSQPDPPSIAADAPVDARRDPAAMDYAPASTAKPHADMPKAASTAADDLGGLEWANRDPRLRHLLVAGGFETSDDLNRIANLLRYEEVDYNALLWMTEADLTSMNIRKGSRVKLLRGIELARTGQLDALRSKPPFPSAIKPLAVSAPLPPGTITRSTLATAAAPQAPPQQQSPPTQYELVSFQYARKANGKASAPAPALAPAAPAAPAARPLPRPVPTPVEEALTQPVANPSPAKFVPAAAQPMPPPVSSPARVPCSTAPASRQAALAQPPPSKPPATALPPTNAAALDMSQLIREMGQSSPAIVRPPAGTAAADPPRRVTRSTSRLSQELSPSDDPPLDGSKRHAGGRRISDSGGGLDRPGGSLQDVFQQSSAPQGDLMVYQLEQVVESLPVNPPASDSNDEQRRKPPTPVAAAAQPSPASVTRAAARARADDDDDERTIGMQSPALVRQPAALAAEKKTPSPNSKVTAALAQDQVEDDELSMYTQLLLGKSSVTLQSWILSKKPDTASVVPAADVRISAVFRRKLLRVLKAKEILHVMDAKSKTIVPGETELALTASSVEAVFVPSPAARLLPGRTYQVTVSKEAVTINTDKPVRSYYWNFKTAPA